MLSRNYFLHGRYRIVRPLGRGGFGHVYEALDDKLDCIVAIKERRAELKAEKLRRAFEREAKLLANLRHFALPKVTDHFVEGDGQFLVMEFVEGDDFARLLSKRRVPFTAEEIFPWTDDILKALEYLHTQDEPVIHRDIKPANLKLTERGEVFLLDFGLAKGYAGSMPSPETGQRSSSVHGYTEAYAPLEQLHRAGTDERSDIYSLGATLYHLLTGRLPVSAGQRYRNLDLSGKDLFPPAHEVNSTLPVPVSLIISKAMSLQARERFATATQMRASLIAARDEIERTARQALEESISLSSEQATHDHQEHHREAVPSTMPSSTIPRANFTVKPELGRLLFEQSPSPLPSHDPVASSQAESQGSWPSQLSSHSTDSLWPSSVGIGESTVLDDQDGTQLQDSLLEAEPELAEVSTVLQAAVVAETGQQGSDSDFSGTKEPDKSESAPVLDHELKSSALIDELRTDSEYENAPLLSVGITTLATPPETVSEASAPVKAKDTRVEAEVLTTIAELPSTIAEQAQKRSDTSGLTESAEAPAIAETSSERLRTQASVHTEAQLRTVATGADLVGSVPVVTAETADLSTTVDQQRSLVGRSDSVGTSITQVPLTRRKSRILILGTVAAVIIVSIVALVKLAATDRGPAKTDDGSNSNQPASAAQASAAAPTSPATKGQSPIGLKKTLENFGGKVWSVVSSPDGAMFLAATESGKIRAWDTKTLTQKYTIQSASAPTKDVNSIAFSPDGRFIAGGSSDQTVRLWNAADGSDVKILAKDQGEILAVAFSPVGEFLATGAANGNISIWNLATGTRVDFKGNKGEVWALVFSPDGKVLVSGGKDGIKFWDVRVARLWRTIAVNETICLAFSPDSQTLASGHRDNLIRLWLNAKGPPTILKGHQGYVASLAFAPSGVTLASASGDQTIKLWDFKTGVSKQTLSEHGDKVYSVNFAGGNVLISGSRDQTVRIWE